MGIENNKAPLTTQDAQFYITINLNRVQSENFTTAVTSKVGALNAHRYLMED